jgi:hypothetical protein
MITGIEAWDRTRIGYQISANANTTAYNGKMGLRMAW